ncbi:4Fe-4S dicluster domain-containing protein [Candidatus Sumerlaeota bacterium]|nr:4Fe-4S dicluster domain-containing protein [Candidatus Sumerlaeota bacterium]
MAVSNLTDHALSPGTLPHSERVLRKAFLDQVDDIPGGEKLRKCIQCGTCTGSCPLSYTMDVSPREVIARFRAGDIESLLRSRTIWTCASCYNCTVRCPAGIKITDLLYALKRMSMDQGIYPKRFPVYVFSESFVKMVKRYGRNWEVGLMERFQRRTTTPVLGLFKSMSMLPIFFKLFRRGRVNIFPKKIKGIRDLKRIIEKAEQMERPVERIEEKRPTRVVGYEAIGS